MTDALRLHNLRYVGRVTRPDAAGKPEWCGDCFKQGDGGVYMPLTEESIAATLIDQVMKPHQPKVQTLAYDYEAARRVVSCSADATYHKSPRLGTPDLVLGEPAPLSCEERDHLLYLRLDGQFEPWQTLENVAFLNRLTARGVVLPEVIDGGAVYTASDGFEGDVRLVRKDVVWDSYFIHSGFLRDEDSVFSATQLTSHMTNYLGALNGCAVDRSPVSRVVINALLCREVQECLTRSDDEKYNRLFPHQRTVGAFHLAAVLCARRSTNGIGNGLLFTRWTNETAAQFHRPWSNDTLFVPYKNVGTTDGIRHVTLYPDQSKRVFLDDAARLIRARPIPFDPSVRPLLETYAVNKTPTLGKPYCINIHLG